VGQRGQRVKCHAKLSKLEHSSRNEIRRYVPAHIHVNRWQVSSWERREETWQNICNARLRQVACGYRYDHFESFENRRREGKEWSIRHKSTRIYRYWYRMRETEQALQDRGNSEDKTARRVSTYTRETIAQTTGTELEETRLFLLAMRRNSSDLLW